MLKNYSFNYMLTTFALLSIILLSYMLNNINNQKNTSLNAKNEYSLNDGLSMVMNDVVVKNRLQQYARLNYNKDADAYKETLVGDMGDKIPAAKDGQPALKLSEIISRNGENLYIIVLAFSEVDEPNSPEITFSFNPRTGEINPLKNY